MPARRSSLAVVLAAVALAAPAAQARPIEPPAAALTDVEAQALASHGPGAPQPGAPAPRPDALDAYALAGSAPVVERAAVPDPGFDWGSAAVGATAGAGALGVLALAGLSTGGRRRVRVVRG